MSGQTAANILKKFPFDDALTIKIVGVLGEDKEKIHEFLIGVGFFFLKCWCQNFVASTLNFLIFGPTPPVFFL